MAKECVICFEKLEMRRFGRQVVHFSCGHCFHYACIRQWYSRQENCPVCRQNIDLRFMMIKIENTKPKFTVKK